MATFKSCIYETIACTFNNIIRENYILYTLPLKMHILYIDLWLIFSISYYTFKL